MRSFTKLLLAVILLTGSTYAFASPHIVVKADSSEWVIRSVSNFDQLKIQGPFEVHITQGTVESLKLKAPSEILDRILTEVNGSELRIQNKHDNWGWGEKSWWSDKSWWRHHDKIVVYLTVKNLNSISTSGSNNVTFEYGLTANSLKLRVRGSGNVEGKITVKTLESSLSGSANVKLSGKAENSTIKVSGSGNFTAPDLVTVSYKVHVSGSGGVKINANDRIDAAISGSGGVSYTGTAKVAISKKSGSGSIQRF